MTTRNRQIRSPQAQGSIPPEKIRDAVASTKAASKALDHCVTLAATSEELREIGRRLGAEMCPRTLPTDWESDEYNPNTKSHLDELFTAQWQVGVMSVADPGYWDAADDLEVAQEAVHTCDICREKYDLWKRRKELVQERGNARRALALIGRGEMSRRETP